jgi:hypothetical protein
MDRSSWKEVDQMVWDASGEYRGGGFVGSMSSSFNVKTEQI